MTKIFRFKKFSVDQTDCGMKVNTDAALLGALTQPADAQDVLEIGTGTGVIALMIAQRYPQALIDAVEIDAGAAAAAALNFKNSPFSSRLRLIKSSFQDLFQTRDKKYNAIVSNPPYFINSLKSGDVSREISRHTDQIFFQDLITGVSEHLSDHGTLHLILPLDTAAFVAKICSDTGGSLHLQKRVLIHSFPQSKPYRCILTLGLDQFSQADQKFVIYESQNVYSAEYRELLKDYLTIF